MNYLRPDLKRGNFSPDEDELIVKLHSLLGNRYCNFDSLAHSTVPSLSPDLWIVANHGHFGSVIVVLNRPESIASFGGHSRNDLT